MKRALVLVVLLCAGYAFAQTDDPALIENAKTFAEIGDWENGLKLLEQYILRHPKDAEARLLLAECYFNWPDKQTQGERVVDLNQQRGKAQIEVLGKLGDDGFTMLLRGTRSDTYRVHNYSAYELERMKDRRAIDPLIALAREMPDRAARSINALARIDEGRETADKGIVEFLVSLLRNEGTEQDVRVVTVSALARLRAAEALPAVKSEIERILAEIPDYTGDSRWEAQREALYAVDFMSRISAPKVSEVLDEAVTSVGKFAFFDVAEREAGELAISTRVLLTAQALDMVKADPGIAWNRNRKVPRHVEYFLEMMASDSPGALLEERNRKCLHELLDSPLPADVRVGLARLAAEIRDEEALPFLFAKLSPRLDVRAARASWVADGSSSVWEAAQKISGEKALAFLVEKLKSDDMAWVAMSATLLKERGDRKAAEALAERYREIKSLIVEHESAGAEEQPTAGGEVGKSPELLQLEGQLERGEITLDEFFTELQMITQAEKGPKRGMTEAEYWAKAAEYDDIFEAMQHLGPPPDGGQPRQGAERDALIKGIVLEIIRSAYKELTGKDIEGGGEEKREGYYWYVPPVTLHTPPATGRGGQR